MRIVLDDGAAERELVVELGDDDATVADLLTAAGTPIVDTVTIDGRLVPSEHTLAESAIPDGATIRPGRVGVALRTVGERSAPVVVAVVAGTTAGAAVPLGRPVVVGRDEDCDLVVRSTTVSGHHCRIVDDGRGGVTVTDLGSTNGTWVDGEQVPSRGGRRVAPGAIVRCGATALRIEPVPDDDRPRGLDPVRHLTSAGTVPFNRPPRPAPPHDTGPVRALPPAPPPRERARFNLASIIAPLVLAGVMVVVMDNAYFALFALATPVMMVTNTVGERRRAGRSARAAAREHTEAVARFVDDVRRAQSEETRRRWTVTPSLAELRRRATVPSTRLWERRRHDRDQLVLGAGIGSVPFRPALVDADGRPTDETPLAREILDTAERLPDAAVPVDLSRGGVVGIVGDRTAAVALARSLVVQAAVLHGPADLPLAAVVDDRAVGAWSWLPWLPHTAGSGPDAPRSLAVGSTDGVALLRRLIEVEEVRQRGVAGRGGLGAAAGPSSPAGGRDVDARPSAPTLLVLLDAPSLLRGRGAPARAVLRGDAGPVAGIVLATTEDELPAVCDTVVTCRSADGDAALVRPAERLLVPDLLVAGCAETDARLVARRLAGLEDPEVTGGAGQLPVRIDLLDLLDLDGPGGVTAASISERWQETEGDTTIGTPIGVTGDGPLHLDLVADGPHGLLGGTTGSGKSELLRSLVAGLATRHDPEHLTFVLVDYKGGAAFDVCADLPHVVGLVTDLDEHLGERALRSLEAELAHRERRLRALGASDLSQWLRLPPDRRGEPLPRLLVVVDEFATLKAELPDFVDALVGIAQRGRSLGVHMLLGTQRPSGAVDENVRANSNLRIALRVTDRHDSSDVVGVPDAADISPSLPGRGVVRIGPGSVVPVQTALVTGRSARAAGPAVRVRPLRMVQEEVTPGAGGDDGSREEQARAPSDLDRLVAACREAFDQRDGPPPRQPWLPPLPARIDLDDVLGAEPASPEAGAGADVDGIVPMGLVDLPDRQAQEPAGWDLGAGTLLVHGVVGSGTTTTAATAVLAAARRHPPDLLHVQVLDLGRGELAPLAALPHVGAVVTGREDERRQRMLRWLLAEGARRRQLSADELAREPRLVVVVDGFDQLVAELDDPATYEQQEALLRFVADSAGVRTSCLLTTTRAGGLRSALTGAVEQRWAMRLASPDELSVLGLRPADVPLLRPGGAVRVSDGSLLQVAHPGDLTDAVATVAARWPRPSRPPASIRTLPSVVPAAGIAASLAAPAAGAWWLPVGRSDVDLDVAAMPLHHGEHALVLGGPGSGRSGLLGALAAIAAAADVDVVVAAGSAGSPLLGDGVEVVDGPDLGTLLRERHAEQRPLLVLVDDAERVPDPGAPLDALTGDGARVHLVCAARPETVQADFSHWLRRVARSRVGAVLRPSGDVAGDLLGARLPRRPPAAVMAGRGWLVAQGELEFVQFATPA